MENLQKQSPDPGFIASPLVDERFETIIGEPSTLYLVRRLCESLKVEGVNYCHWKSTAALDRSALGENDLDLLVSSSDVARFTEILYRLGFKRAHNPYDLKMPGVLDYYGYDQPSDRLVHVHAHYRLILGHDMSKNFHIPLEEPYLASSLQGDLFRVPLPEFELIIFVIRMMVKHSTWDTILGRQGALSISERQELAYLQTRSDFTLVYNLLKLHLPFIDEALFASCLQALLPGCSTWTRITTGQKLINRLRPLARRPQVADLLLKFRTRAVGAIRRRILRHEPKPHLAGGGALIAIVGGDGAGKSTAVEELSTWLSSYFETTRKHMGKPAWSFSTVVIRGVLKIGRSLGFYPFMRVPLEQTLIGNSSVFPGYPWLIREVCTAHDRFLTYARARRIASNGGLVICDRYPLAQIKLMDGPVAERMTGGCNKNWLIKNLTRIENNYYRQIMLPDILVVLRVDPEIAVQRKTDEDEASVRARTKEIWELDFRELPAHIIDANRSKAEVLSELKVLVWSEL
jgi:thymidylate kinase